MLNHFSCSPKELQQLNADGQIEDVGEDEDENVKLKAPPTTTKRSKAMSYQLLYEIVAFV